MRFLVDMNLTPRWCDVLRAEGWDAVHWSEVGIATAPDSELMAWALGENRIVLTHDLDFGAMLAATQSAGPSVAQVRTQDVRPEALSATLIPLLRQFETELTAGALLIVDEGRSRVPGLAVITRLTRADGGQCRRVTEIDHGRPRLPFRRLFGSRSDRKLIGRAC